MMNFQSIIFNVHYGARHDLNHDACAWSYPGELDRSSISIQSFTKAYFKSHYDLLQIPLNPNGK